MQAAFSYVIPSVQVQSGDLIGPPYSGVSSQGRAPLGCRTQVDRARRGVNLSALSRAEALVANDPTAISLIPVQVSGCTCRIAENGLVDPSECTVQHIKFPVPVITRWYSDVTVRICGGTYLAAWSGWAAPAVMSLLGRYPLAIMCLSVWYRTSNNARHNDRVKLTHMVTLANGAKVWAMRWVPAFDKNCPRFTVALTALPRLDRVGGLST